MSGHSTNVDAKTSWEIHACETWSARQKILADSINDTARMARTTLSFFLLVAFYLFLIILASNDEQFLRGREVTLPQVGVGISIKNNYVIGPLIFFYLYVQLLFLLGILVRKIREFIKTSNDGPPVKMTLTTRRRGDAEDEWDWLSAFVFVQLFRPNDSRRWLFFTLSFVSMVMIPILLLLAVDFYFVRYQSIIITNFHHVILILYIISVIIFITYVFHDKIILIYCHCIFWMTIIGGVMLFSHAQPPQFSANSKMLVWNSRKNEEFWNWSMNKDHSMGSFDILCELTRNWPVSICRYIDVSEKVLTGTRIELPNKDIKTKGVYINKFDLSERTLRYARFRQATLAYVEFRYADLRDSDFGFAIIDDSSFRYAQLHDANFTETKLNGTDFAGAELYGTIFSGANLRNADFRGAKLYGANLEGAELHGADFRFAKLHGANLEGAELHGANLRNAELYGANLEDIELDGVDLGNTKLAGSFGVPGSWKFVWISDKSFFFPIDPVSDKSISMKSIIKQSVDDFEKQSKIENIKIYWKEDEPMENYEAFLEENIQENFWKDPGIVSNTVEEDMIHITHKLGIPEWLHNLSTDDNEEYWKNRAKWVTDFACRNEYTARSIMKRWMSDTPLQNIKTENLGMAMSIIIDDLKYVKKLKKRCFGLYILPDDEWQEFLRTTRSRVEQRSGE